MEYMDAARRQGFAALLQRQRETLLRHLAGSPAEHAPRAQSREPGTPGAPADPAPTATGDGRTRLALDKIDAALARLAAGSYGTCSRCGREIALARLALVPATEFCLRCARHPPRARRRVAHFIAGLARFYRR
jgi:RNA polymerase-binding transcription factor DksA